MTSEFIRLRTGLKKMTIQECAVKDAVLAEIADDQPVIGGTAGLQLDSLDAVEIVAALERSFGIRFESAGASRPIFNSFNTMAEYVLQNAPKDRIDQFVALHPLS